MTKQNQATLVADFARGMANRMLSQGTDWQSNQDWWWILSQLAAKVNELETAMKDKTDVTDLVHDIAINTLIIKDLQINHVKPSVKKKLKKRTTKRKTKAGNKKKVTKKRTKSLL